MKNDRPYAKDKIRIGISACLLGQPVRYDGGHKLDRFLAETLGRYVDYIPVCPEVECGMPVPREAMRLVGAPESPRLVTIRTRIDKTDQMLAWAKKKVAELEKEKLRGSDYLHEHLWSTSRFFQLKRRAACMIPPFERIS